MRIEVGDINKMGKSNWHLLLSGQRSPTSQVGRNSIDFFEESIEKNNKDLGLDALNGELLLRTKCVLMISCCGRIFVSDCV